jgi:hypothetical protein
MHGVMRQRFTVYSLAAVASILLSIWAAAKTSVINPDAICYLYSAAAMEKGLTIATHLCEQSKWPFYSILIFGLSKLTSLSFTSAAFCLNGFFSLISVLTFIAIVNQLTNHPRIIALSACVILLAHTFNGLRVEIIRDHGFWAFYLLSVFFILQVFKKNNSFCYALLWSISLSIATLFRIEGAVFLLLLPFILFFDTRQTILLRIKTFLQLYLLTVLATIALLLWIIFHPTQTLGRLPEIQFQLTHGITELLQAFRHTTNALENSVLNAYSARDANLITIGMLMCWYIFNVVSNVSFIYAILIIYAWWKKLANFTHEKQLIVWGYIVINILITGIFLIENGFLAARYLIALSFILMLWVPFALENLIQQWPKHKWPLLLAVLLIIIYGAGGIFDFGHSKKYIREGGDWLASHATVNQKIYSNDYQLLYYSNQLGDKIFSEGRQFQNLNSIANGKWQQYDYIALRVSQDELKKLPILREINLTPVAIFQNDRNDQVIIYKNRRVMR